MNNLELLMSILGLAIILLVAFLAGNNATEKQFQFRNDLISFCEEYEYDDYDYRDYKGYYCYKEENNVYLERYIKIIDGKMMWNGKA